MELSFCLGKDKDPSGGNDDKGSGPITPKGNGFDSAADQTEAEGDPTGEDDGSCGGDPRAIPDGGHGKVPDLHGALVAKHGNREAEIRHVRSDEEDGLRLMPVLATRAPGDGETRRVHHFALSIFHHRDDAGDGVALMPGFDVFPASLAADVDGADTFRRLQPSMDGGRFLGALLAREAEQRAVRLIDDFELVVCLGRPPDKRIREFQFWDTTGHFDKTPMPDGQAGGDQENCREDGADRVSHRRM